ncbi:hypothetical protein QCA50_014317 [Cerrena zonata]|uniref:PARP catalytic domain-containing protein n=1 Tax=Cerrena zonata TaxID=2478898 RepID=A0AAW0FTA1_9APHY
MDEFCIEHPSNVDRCSRHARLVRVDEDSCRFNEISELFRRGWRHPEKPTPYLHAIYKIISPESNITPFLKYQSTVMTTYWWSPFIRAGSEALLFHGTNRACLLGETPENVMPCKLPQCSLCFIIRESFDVRRCGNKNKFARFGKGIYTSACSSKADDYVKNIARSAKHHVLLLNRVAPGKTFASQQNAQHLSAPPPGYHSVLGVPGADLNYEETVVYSNDAIRPGYLIVYGELPTESRGRFKESLRKFFTTPVVS